MFNAHIILTYHVISIIYFVVVHSKSYLVETEAVDDAANSSNEGAVRKRGVKNRGDVGKCLAQINAFVSNVIIYLFPVSCSNY